MTPPNDRVPFLFGRNIGWWTVILVIVLLLFVGSYQLSKLRSGSGGVAPNASVPHEEPPLTQEKMGTPRESVLPPDLTDPSVLKTASPSGQLPDSAFRYLLYQFKSADPQKMKDIAGRAKAVSSPADFDTLKPGDPVSLEGTLASVRKRDKWGIPEADINDVMQCEIRDAQNRVYLVYTVHDMWGTQTGDNVKLVGRFLRMYPHAAISPNPSAPAAAEAAKPEPQPTPVIIALQLEASQYLTDPTVLQNVRDQTSGVDPKAFYYLVHQVQQRTQEQMKEQADPALTCNAIEKDPASARGKGVAIEGALMQIRRRNEVPNIAGLDHLYPCFMFSNDGHRILLYVLENPINLGTPSTVKVYGAFLETKVYNAGPGGNQELTGLVVIARQLVPVKIKTSTSLGWIASAVIVGITVIIALAVWADRKSARKFQKTRNEILERHKKTPDEEKPGTT